jgi:hypothetical protein
MDKNKIKLMKELLRQDMYRDARKDLDALSPKERKALEQEILIEDGLANEAITVSKEESEPSNLVIVTKEEHSQQIEPVEVDLSLLTNEEFIGIAKKLNDRMRARFADVKFHTKADLRYKSTPQQSLQFVLNLMRSGRGKKLLEAWAKTGFDSRQSEPTKVIIEFKDISKGIIKSNLVITSVEDSVNYNRPYNRKNLKVKAKIKRNGWGKPLQEFPNRVSLYKIENEQAWMVVKRVPDTSKNEFLLQKKVINFHIAIQICKELSEGYDLNEDKYRNFFAANNPPRVL